MASKGEEKEMTMAEMEKHMKLARALAKRYPIFTLEQIVKFKQEFDEFDLDGSGDIDKYEVMQMFEKFGEKVSSSAPSAASVEESQGHDPHSS
jgi:Ca2+-binding EF-hand superfamily protein